MAWLVVKWPQVEMKEAILEEIAMYSPSKILAWIRENVEVMRLSRAKTLAAIVSAAVVLKGVGVLALGRSMQGEVAAKHCIKRVWRFLRNQQLETEAVFSGLFHFLRPARGRVLVLADWTSLTPFQQLVLSLPRDGRSLPFLAITVPQGSSEKEQQGHMKAAEQRALEMLARMCGSEIKPVILADRGFGHPRWLADIRRRGWDFVQRVPKHHQVWVEHYAGVLRDLGIRRGWRPRDWGWGTMNEQDFGPVRLVTVFEREAEEPWYLVTSLEAETPANVVRLYKRRMWIEAMFRDLKNRDWGMGLDQVRLSEPERHDRHFAILALAYLWLFAFGALAERQGLAKRFKANTRAERVITLVRTGYYYLFHHNMAPPEHAFAAVQALPT